MSLKLKKIMKKRKGFTLLEVLLASLALAIVATILFGLTTSAHLTTLNITEKIIAQNIAQATLEDLKAQNNYRLAGLVAGNTSFSTNYPIDGKGKGDGTSYHLNTGEPILLKDIVPFSDPLLEAKSSSNLFSADGTRINLFNYTNPIFNRDITITDSEPAKSIPDKNYNITIEITWKLNSADQKGQHLTITGTKN